MMHPEKVKSELERVAKELRQAADWATNGGPLTYDVPEALALVERNADRLRTILKEGQE